MQVGDSPGGTQFDEKNIRRRVYDALNVLAMDIISKDKIGAYRICILQLKIQKDLLAGNQWIT
jgi:hypothetical protein